MPHTVYAKLILRNDLRDTWRSRNPILSRGEMGAEIDTGLLKLGDGLTPYNELDYINEKGGRNGDDTLVTVVNNKFTVANYGQFYYRYNPDSRKEVKVIQPDLSQWPPVVELEVKDGVARWVEPPNGFVFDKIRGTISGATISLAKDPENTTDAATKNYVDQSIASAIANLPHLKRKVVTELPAPLYAEENTIYMIKDVSATGADKYKEYLLIDYNLVQIGDTSVDLSNYVQKPNSSTVGNIVTFGSDGALVDSNVSINNVNQLNIANTLVLGGVLASTSANYVNVDSTGRMFLNDVTTDKLINGLNEFILDGGGA